ncbi:hypothetical protein GQ55_9G174900 [Panicum hallii var. hallii]|uniref:Myb-like domain-containing protein n=1 Tax=Panicum hallii var. hallii TaxID=1504633 RepID=A0A2T7C487_9POAL|nr:hypothetical protein GQ55_9G174900 [Panicum hallii var. hallii]PUZ38161.1 hypothetical protein GQ55_9G174900 [Panicum hallii var. hallii]
METESHARHRFGGCSKTKKPTEETRWAGLIVSSLRIFLASRSAAPVPPPAARRPPPCSPRVSAPPAREPFPRARALNFFRALPNPIGTKAPSLHPYISPPQFFPIHSLRKKSSKSLCLPATISKTRHQSFVPVEELLPKPCARMNPTGPKKHQSRSCRTVVESAALAPAVDGAAGADGAPDTSAAGGGAARASGPVAGFPASGATGAHAAMWSGSSRGSSECGTTSHSTMSPTDGCSKGTPSPTGSSGTAQMGSQDRKTIDVEDDGTIQPARSNGRSNVRSIARSTATPDARSDRRLNWSIEEDIRLVSAWLHNSIDPVDGNNKKSDQYWSDVTSTYNSSTKCSCMRNRNQLKLRWEHIKKPVTEFNGCYARITKVHQSGMSDDQKMDQAMQLYAYEHSDKPFTLLHVWRIVRHEKKMVCICEET